MTARSTFGQLRTPAKLLILLALVMLPIGGLLMWSALRDIQSANVAMSSVAGQQARASVRAIDSLIARNALALRVAANAAVGIRGENACVEAARTLAITPAVARQFEIEDANGIPLCAKGDFADIANPPRARPGDIRLWIAEDERSLLIRTGVEGGSATSRISAPELSAALRSEGAAINKASVDDGRKRIVLIGTSDTRPSDEPVFRQRIKIGAGRLEAEVTSPGKGITTFEKIVILLPFVMSAIAALLSWWLVNHLLVRPLSRLQRSISDHRPGEDSQLIEPEQLGPAIEIRELRDAFVRAVERIEETERGMAEALEGQRKLVREVHHRVKNNLQVVASLLSIHGRSADSQEGKAAFAAIGRRVDALSVVHRNHYAELEDNQGIALRALLTELSGGLRASAADTNRGVAIEIDIDSASTTQDVAVAVAFFVTEIVEYAMLHGESAPVEIEMRRTSPLTGRLTIASAALLESDQDPAERRQFERIVEGLARQLRSPLDRNLGRYHIDLPLFPER
ncbi:MAG TPA: sensor histidine kinase [Sphingomicrobium sp.]|nr:sensor histidine kinase [Sphingomicrobium sp.]